MMDTKTLKSLFSERIKSSTLQAAEFRKKYNIISIIRLSVAIAILGCIVMCFYKIYFILFSIGTIFLSMLFIFLLLYHKKIEHKIIHKDLLIKINENELNCLEGHTQNNFQGDQYNNPKHPYSSDLDIFGKASLYQYLCRAWTKGGRDLLAFWLHTPSTPQEIIQRQNAIRELTEDQDWRQEVEVQARGLKSSPNLQHKIAKQEDVEDIYLWLKKPAFINNLWPMYVVYALQALTIFAIISVLLGLPGKLLFIPLLLNVFFISKFRKQIQSLRENTSKHTRYLKSFGNIIACLESRTFKSPLLQKIKTNISSGSLPASKELNKLSALLFNLESTENPYFYPLGNYFLVWDLYWAMRLEKWKIRNADHVNFWFQGIYEIETLNSLAAGAYLNPDWNYPSLSSEKFYLKASNIGHPLLPRTQRVKNSLYIEGIGKCIVITGSNMSGKSTFLRTIGINTVMAFAGLPVCADQFEVSQLRLYTSMRTQDSLEENTSSFYAELKRLKGLLESLTGDIPVFYLLDEILKGTNSQDRHKGAKAIINQMNLSNASGMISTHDLELGEVANKDPEHVFNYSFNSYLDAGKLTFDYKIRPGICNSFNASELMKQIGIKIKED